MALFLAGMAVFLLVLAILGALGDYIDEREDARRRNGR